MGIDILIDKLTPCLEKVSTGETIQTVFSIAKPEELRDLHAKGWLFDWQDDSLDDCLIYKLTLKDDGVVQGLIAMQIDKKEMAIYVSLAESAPHNRGENKEYSGVGGHLFAIAIKLSLQLGFGGFVYMDAKNIDLVEHYRKALFAVRMKTRIHEYRMAILEESASEILETYNLEGDLNVE